ncbi:MAG: extracellular solute-binding protein [Christensenellales bacterium]|jgi:ABC-type glycerol-3-phosphate transport system substrate-binding protein
MKRFLSMLLAACLALGLCLTAVAEQDIIKASAIVFTSIGFTPQNNSDCAQYILEHFGLDLDIQPVDSGTEESWNIFWASDGYADIILPYHLGAARAIVDNDLCRPISFDMLKEHAPRLITLLLSVYGSEEEIIKNLSYRGEIWCFPYFAVTNGISWISSVRNDWLEKVGLSVPTTIDELTEVLRAFTEDDPDGNGVNDTYGANSLRYSLWNVPAAYGTTSVLSYWTTEDGTDIYTNADTEEYRNFLRKVHEWYAAGYIDPEFITDEGDRAAARSKFASGKFGLYCDNPWWFEDLRGEIGPLRMLCDTDPSVDYSTGFSFFGGLQNGDTPPTINSLYNNITGQASVYFGYNCPDETVIRVIQMQNRRVILEDGSEEDKISRRVRAEMDMGVEGVDWEWDENGKAKLIRPPLSAEEGIKRGTWSFPVASTIDFDVFVGEPDEFVIDVYKMSMSLDRIYNGSNFSKPGLSAEATDMQDMISTYYTECRNKFINGDMSLDNDWDAYCQQLKDYGIDTVIAEYKAGLGL